MKRAAVVLYFAAITLLLFVGTTALAVEAVPKSLATRQAGIDWPGFLGPHRDSKSPETGILTKWPEAGPALVWSKKIGTGYAIGSMAYGRLYQFDKYADQAVLLCLHAETGEELWRFAYPSTYTDLYGYNDGPRCSPLIDGNRVYLYGVEGMLHCVHAETGKLLWKVDTVREFGVVQNFFGVGSSPIIVGDVLVAMVGGSPPEAAAIPPGQLDRVTGNGSAIVGFDKFTGEVKYKTSKELASYASLQTAVMHGRPYLFAFCRGGLVACHPQTGREDFFFPWRATILESVNASTPVVAGNHVLLSETYGPGGVLLDIQPAGPKVSWSDADRGRRKSLQAHWNTPVLHDGYLYGSSGRHTDNAQLRCVKWDTGEVQWSVPDLTRVSLLFIDGHFLSLGEYGDLLLFKANPQKFELVAQAALEAEGRPLLKYPCWSAPVVSHGLLYLRGDDRLICLDLIPPAR